MCLKRGIFGVALLAMLACANAPAPAAVPSRAAPAPVASTKGPVADSQGKREVQAPRLEAASVESRASSVPFLHDDFDGALEQARVQGKLLFVDAWAEWCHTCKSMKAFVFSEPALAPFAERIVFAALDTDKPVNAAFLEKYEVRVWPSLFAIEPEARSLVGFWPGSASLEELRDFLTASLEAHEALGQRKLDPNGPLSLLIRARAAHSEGDLQGALRLYDRALAAAPEGWTRASETLHGKLWALAQARRTQECIAFGEQHLTHVRGSSLPTFFASIFLDCLEHEQHAVRRTALRRRAIMHLSGLLSEPPASMSADDREDAWRIVAEAWAAEGNAAEARAAQKRRLEIMERAAQEAGSPSAAATFDAGRAQAYLALGRGEEAVALLRARIEELPDSYEPPARLAQILEVLGKTTDALAAVDLALARAYGPRRLRYLEQKARLLGALGRTDEQIATLEAEVKGYQELRGGQASLPKQRAAQARLARARQDRNR
jgi:tetratricopeptide (TPR) repeat protein